ncbi:MAG TPA: SDR family NAD(P)-dependent oxidoreductase [Beijerinckiaceae bacterium]|jgi:NAD(P)-dependent dehydrogenase (short-subunit alcohol dehydrogenase family)
MMRLQDKVAIVTGGSSGIGLASARRLGAEGARIVIASQNKGRIEAAAERVRAEDKVDVLGLECDVSQEEQVVAVVEKTLEKFGRLDVVVNNAGMMLFKPLEEYTPAEWERVLGVDLMGSVHFTKQAFLHMKEGGAIVNVASIHALVTSPLVAPYATAKAATLSLTRSAAIEGRDKGIRANVILPGAIDTPMLWDNPNVKSGAEKIDPKDVGRPEDVAAAVAFLASDDARFITGTALRVDGGRLDRL